MGRPKASLPLSDRADTFLSRIIRTCTHVPLPDIVVVVGASAASARASAGVVDRRVRFVHNPEWESGQLSSLLVGLDAPVRGAVSEVEGVLVMLVDVPLVSAETMSRVIHAWRNLRAPIVRPARGGQHGHPVIFDRALFGALHDADRQVGAKAVVRAHEREIANVPVEDPGAFLDIDTEDDYRAVLKRLSDFRLP
jgi:molybdenum cofactor cytidylyltransferase